MNNAFEQVKAAWADEMAKQSNGPALSLIASGDVNLNHYKGLLLETYHNAGLNPQLQAYATLFLDGNPRNVVKKFFQHAIAEIGHDLLAKNDLMALGVDEKTIVESQPSPENLAFVGYFLHQIQFVSGLTYLGYLFHLEFTPTVNGRKYIEMFEKKGVSKDALTFLEEHATVDIHHNKFMETYTRELLKTPADVELVCRSVRAAVRLHMHMVWCAFQNGERLFGAQKAA